ncbi:zinc finger MYND domain-containing protein 12 [Aplysia californica]|uniref:Zinc finger MYND domain-containing protein 12 n=1 Tax=Aplysia californica TaxID=6500 RepID=A0ABM0ZUZ3_APLCA|nr:zinc finger MYND domain-containing protein 12 [Aplysia californica]
MIEDVTHTDVNPLASPKGTHKPCIRCGERSRFMCKKCRAVFYCSKAHRDEDLRVLHSDVCDLYAFLKDSIRFVPGQDERDRLEKQRVIKKTEILKTAKSLAQKSLFQNHPDDAINQLSVAIHFAHELYGNNSVLIIPIHAMCVEALVKRGRMDQATQQLSKAEWILLNEDDCPDLIKADFYKNEGFLNMCKKEYKSALTSYANETFFSTAAFHPV